MSSWLAVSFKFSPGSKYNLGKHDLHYALVKKLSESENLKSFFEKYPEIEFCSVFNARWKAVETADMWNESYVRNGNYVHGDTKYAVSII